LIRLRTDAAGQLPDTVASPHRNFLPSPTSALNSAEIQIIFNPTHQIPITTTTTATTTTTTTIYEPARNQNGEINIKVPESA